MQPEEKAAWLELADISPEGILTRADRWLVEICARTMAKLLKFGVASEVNPMGISNGELAALTQALGRMGFTPSDRSKISVPQDDTPSNPFAEIAEENREIVN